ncbi:ubiquitin-protein transferase activating protein [Apophysomyces ossiformis]|uniref:Ubiquitin-protein transferase activating protein n=1 Tax=Apophysomyces ossiformis TaxID=679940 RepID=A0A8H7BJG8_9FUNG|nr:ubiquitin-protein transferase activating protein [Apophysomyces ossiformis]
MSSPKAEVDVKSTTSENAFTASSPTKGKLTQTRLVVTPTGSSKTLQTNAISTSTTATSSKSKTENTPAKKQKTLTAHLRVLKNPATSLCNREREPKRSRSAHSSLDTVLKQWLETPPATKKAKIGNHDRVIPNRDNMNIESSQFLLTHKPVSKYLDLGTRTVQQQISKACGLNLNQRILSFQSRAPPKENERKDMELRAAKTTTSVPKRRIMTSPEKILDAPYMTDDYYLNLLDWSSLNVVAIGLDRAVYLWNADNGSIAALNYEEDEAVTSLSWSADGSYLAIGTASGDTQIWDVETNTKLRSMLGRTSRVGVLSWDKHIVSSGAKDGSIWNHDVRAPKHKTAELLAHEDEVCGLKWRWDGMMLASGGNDNIVNVWDPRNAKPRFTKRVHKSAVKALAWCPWSHNLLATGGGREDKHIHFWNASTTARVNSVYAGSQVTSLTWSKHYKEIVSSHGYPNNHLTVWGYPTMEKLVEIPAHDSRILHAAMSPDGEVVATAAADENLKFWRLFESDGQSTLGSGRDRFSMLKKTKSIR